MRENGHTEDAMLIKRFGIGLLAFAIGAVGFVLLFLIIEGTHNPLLGYAVDTVLFALAAYGFSRADFGGRIGYGLLVCAPVLLLSAEGVDPASGRLALLMAAITLGVAILPAPRARNLPSGPLDRSA
jgi:hypothetical protein